MYLQRAEKIFCLGDVVGYGPYPRQCLEIVREIAEITILGNHEDSVIHPLKGEARLGELALEGVRYARRQLQPEDIEAIKTWPERLAVPGLDLALAHGSYSGSDTWDYVFGEGEAEEESAHVPEHICILGHTHYPLVFASVGGLVGEIPERLELKKSRRYLINVGSVGQPRDGDSRASYGLFDFVGRQVAFSLRRVDYDIGKTARGFRGTGLPDFLAKRLFKGR